MRWRRRIAWVSGASFLPVPDGHYELKSFAVDDEHGNVTASAVSHGTHTVDAGNGAPTVKSMFYGAAGEN